MIEDYTKLIHKISKEQMELYKIYSNLKFYQLTKKRIIKDLIEKYDKSLKRNLQTIETIIKEETT